LLQDSICNFMKKLFIPPVFVLLSFILIIVFYIVFPESNVIPFPFNLAGLLVSFGGFMIMGKARDQFRKYNTALGMDKASHLICDGIFCRTRNPMYIGMFILLLGFGICFGNLYSMVTALGFLLVMGLFFVPREERMMQDAFGEEYAEYRKKVRRWL